MGLRRQAGRVEDLLPPGCERVAKLLRVRRSVTGIGPQPLKGAEEWLVVSPQLGQGGDAQTITSKALFNAIRVARVCFRNIQTTLLNSLPGLMEPVASRKTAGVGSIGPDPAYKADRFPREEP
jgi:hypothetical protein